MVRGRKIKSAKTDGFEHLNQKESVQNNFVYVKHSITEKLLQKNMEHCNGFSPPITRSRKNARLRRITKSPPKDGQITSYFQIVNSVNCYDEKNASKLFENNPLALNGDYGCYSEVDSENCEFNIDEIIYSDEADEKKAIINNIFKKDSFALSFNSNINGTKVLRDHDVDTYDSAMIKNEVADRIELTNDDDSSNEKTNISEDNTDSTNIRLSPRKHASTLQRCATIKENIKTPHRISLCDNEGTPSHSIRQLTFQSHPKDNQQNINGKLLENKIYSKDDMSSEVEFDEKKNDIASNLSDNKKSSKVGKSCKIIAAPNAPNHKLTEYFPVRRSARKTKKEVLEQKKKDLEMAIHEEREDGLLVTSFEGKGRGVVTSRPFYRGDFVVEYAGELVDIGEARLREAKYAQDHTKGCYMYYFRHNNQNYCIDATAETGRLGRLVNHSRNGNLITKSIFLGSKPHLVLIANQDISPGEEITYDYGDRSKESLQHHPWLAL